MKRLIVEITYESREGLLNALNTIKGRNLQQGEFRSVHEGYSAIGYLHVTDIEQHQVINGQYCHVMKSKV